MPTYAFDPDLMDEETTKRFAPTREEIFAQSDKDELIASMYDAEDIEIRIEVLLQYDMDDRGRNKRIAALIYWRQAIANYKRRLKQISTKDNLAKRARLRHEDLDYARTTDSGRREGLD